MRCIIVEDEYHSAILIRELIEVSPIKVEILDVCRSRNSAIESISRHRPDLVFLDIELPDENEGFMILEKLNHLEFDVIITTGYRKEEYINQALDFNAIMEGSAVRMLFKPIDGTRLHEVLEYLHRERNTSQHKSFRKLGLSSLIQNQKAEGQDKTIVADVDGEDHLVFGKRTPELISLKEICCCEAMGNYVRFYRNSLNRQIQKKSSIGRFKIGDLEKALKAHGFYRPHTSYLVNHNYIERIKLSSGKMPTKGTGGEIVLDCDHGHVLPIARSKRNFFEEIKMNPRR